MRTLIVEDDAPTALLLGMMLEELGIDVCGTEMTEAGAIKAATQTRPDLMIVDVHLRVGSGLSAVREITHLVRIPYIFVSADLSHVRRHDPQAFMVQKPYVFNQMAETIRRATRLVA